MGCIFGVVLRFLWWEPFMVNFGTSICISFFLEGMWGGDVIGYCWFSTFIRN